MSTAVKTETPRVFESREDMLRAECPEGMKVFQFFIQDKDEWYATYYVFARTQHAAWKAASEKVVHFEKKIQESDLLQMYRESFAEKS